MTVYSLFPGWSSLTPQYEPNALSLALGVHVVFSGPGAVTSIEFLAPSTLGDSDYEVELYRVTSEGTAELLSTASAPVGSLTPGQFREVTLPAPVPVDDQHIYCAVVRSPEGHFMRTGNALGSAMSGNDGAVTAPADGSAAHGITIRNCVYAEGEEPGTYPTLTSGDAPFYWLQPFFDDSIFPTVAEPAVEVDTALDLGRRKAAPISPVATVDTAVPLGRTKARDLDAVATVDVAVPLRRVKTRALQTAVETDLAVPIPRPAPDGARVWVWDGQQEIPAALSVWDGQQEVPAVSIQYVP